MEAVLHIEPITRHVQSPIAIGHNEMLYYGERFTDDKDNDNVGDPSSALRLGSPLADLDHGSTRSQIPLVKTFESMPDPTRDTGTVYIETLHYRNELNYLIPYRSKLRSLTNVGRRFNHLPSLNAARRSLTGCEQRVMDPRSEIVTDLLNRDMATSRRQNPPLKDWIGEEFSIDLAKTVINPMSFDTTELAGMINQYTNQVHQTSSELAPRDLLAIKRILMPSTQIIPLQYLSDSHIIKPLIDFKNRLEYNPVNLRSLGRIPIERLSAIEYNPVAFQGVLDLIDACPLTDFNVDVVVGVDDTIVFYHEHLAINRFGLYADNEIGVYSAQTILYEYFNGVVLNEILHKFVLYHGGITNEVEDQIQYNAVKLKLIKTITDEAAVLVYAFDSGPQDAPLCGVYFDIALQALAPMSVLEEPYLN